MADSPGRNTPWHLCPNEPPCEHARVFHDVYDEEDEVPRCCAEGCRCGARAAEGPMTRKEYAVLRDCETRGVTDPGDGTGLSETSRARVRRCRLAADYGIPEHIAASDALALARCAGILLEGTALDDIYAHVYRDSEAFEAWADSNRVHNGVPSLAKVPLPDGRMVGILDLRPQLERFARGEDEDP